MTLALPLRINHDLDVVVDSAGHPVDTEAVIDTVNAHDALVAQVADLDARLRDRCADLARVGLDNCHNSARAEKAEAQVADLTAELAHTRAQALAQFTAIEGDAVDGAAKLVGAEKMVAYLRDVATRWIFVGGHDHGGTRATCALCHVDKHIVADSATAAVAARYVEASRLAEAEKQIAALRDAASSVISTRDALVGVVIGGGSIHATLAATATSDRALSRLQGLLANDSAAVGKRYVDVDSLRKAEARTALLEAGLDDMARLYERRMGGPIGDIASAAYDMRCCARSLLRSDGDEGVYPAFFFSEADIRDVVDDLADRGSLVDSDYGVDHRTAHASNAVVAALKAKRAGR